MSIFITGGEKHGTNRTHGQRIWLIENNNLFNDLEAFKRIAKTHFDKTVKDKNTLFEPDNFILPANIGYTEDGLMLLYNVYEIAPYSTGTIEFTIPYEEVDPVLVLNSSR